MKQHFQASWWARHDVLLMVGGKSLSALGDAVLSIVLLLKVHDAGEGFFAVAALMACESLPMVALMGIAGRIADSRDSRTVLAVTTGLQSVACLLLVSLHGLPAILGIVLVIQSAQAISQATWSALTPRVAGEDNLGKVISLQQGLGAIAMPLGAAIGPVLLGAFGADAAIALDAASFAVLAGAVLLIRTRREVHPSAGQPRGIRLDLLRRDRQLWLLVLGLAPALLVLVAVNVLDVFLVRDNLGVAASWYGLSAVAWGVGAVAGSVLAGSIRTDERRIRGSMASLVVIAGLCIATGLAPNFVVYLACGVGIGVTNAVVNACFGTLLMTRTAEADRGKISATVNGIFQAASLVGLPLGGLLGAVLGTRVAISSAGMATGLLVVAVAIRLRKAGPMTDDESTPALVHSTP